MKTLLIGALAASLVGCSRQPSLQLASGSCTGTNGFACLERTAGAPIKLATFRVNSTAKDTQSASARKTEKSSSAHVRRGVRLATTIAAKAEPPASRVPLLPGSPKTQLQTAGNVAAAESKTTVANIAEPHPTVGPSNFNTRMIEAQVAAATALAERKTGATAAPVPDMKPNDRDRDRDRSSGLETLARGNTEKAESASAKDTDLMVAVLMARPDIKSVSDLTSKTIAIDERHSASNRIVRTALVAAGAPEVQLSEGQATAINRLVNGEVPAAVLALVSADAAEGFSEIPGFKIFHIPLSPRSLKARP